MDLKTLRAFQAIIEYGSFQKAAAKLQYAQSTVTLQVQKLESDLGAALFIRDGKKVHLTEAGRLLALKAGNLLRYVDEIQQTISNVQDGEAGLVRIAAVEPCASVKMASIIADFCRDRPKLELTFEIGNTDFVTGKVLAGEADFGVCSPNMGHNRLIFEPWYEERFCLLIHENHFLSEKESITTNDLSGQRILLKEKNCHYRAMLQRTMLEQGINPFSGMEIGSFDAMQTMVKHQLGIAFIPETLSMGIPVGTLIRQVQGARLGMPMGMIYDDSTIFPMATLALINKLRSALVSMNVE
ncbi:LysR family transcriptional regulator [Paenibacillus macerans]|uniref:LysR family transcriptional regulator n=1 Tax=Paenibacillus macerans TaxID=44252 RepID=UPI003D3113AD